MKRVSMFAMAMLLIAGAWGCASDQTEEELQRSLQIWNKGNLALVDELYAPDFVRHEVDISEDRVGVDAFKEFVSSTRTSYPDFHVTSEEIIVQDDMRVMRVTATGTNTGPRGDSPATGKKIRFSAAIIARVVNGKIVEEWAFYNQGAILLQLGFKLVPPQEQEGD